MWVRGLKHQRQPYGDTHEQVAPYVGAWIETLALIGILTHQFVAPYVGAWIETCIKERGIHACAMSHPMWVRGLKPVVFALGASKRMSHPMWVRGLKPLILLSCSIRNGVAPYVGAWIETMAANVLAAY